jgi:S-adenosylmethionine-diacylglycerol 3-amino-3-carboxypropyl transferase
MTPELFEGTLRSVLRAAAPGSRLIYRSGSYRLDPPEPIRPRLEHEAELSQELLAIDRSATYGSFYVYSVKENSDANESQASPRDQVEGNDPSLCVASSS